jgi:hypothetical protein
MKTALFGLAAAVLTAQLAGCATPVETPPMVVRCGMPASSARPGPALVGQTYGMAMTPLPLNSVQFGTVEASQSLSVQNLYAERSSTDVVLLSVRLVSCLDTPMASGRAVGLEDGVSRTARYRALPRELDFA